jgi:hypothetical protein
MPRNRDRPRSHAESLVTGLVVGGGFIAFWALGGHQVWALLGALFGGLLPAARGLSGMIAARGAAPAARRLGERERALENERAVLRTAREKGGRLTPALVALDCSMSIEEAERVLDGLARKGHSTVQVRDDGRIEYEFSEFLPPADGHRREPGR